MTQLFFVMLLIVIYFLVYLSRRTNNKTLFYLAIIGLTCVAGFRGKTCGVDTFSYYENIANGFPYPWKFREEGFRLVANFFMNNFNNAQLMFVFCALVTNLLVLLRIWDFREDAKIEFMVLLYILLFYSNTLNIMRQYVAVALIFYGTRFLKDHKLWFVPFLVIAFFFHRSALLAVGFLAISLWSGFTKSQKKLFAIPMFAVIAIAVVYVFSYLASDVDSYSAQKISNINITYLYLLAITVFSLVADKFYIHVVLSHTQYGSEVSEYKMDNTIVVYTIIGLLLSSFSLFFSFVGRAGIYYSIYYVVYWGIASEELDNSKFNKLLILIYAFYVFGLVVFKNDMRIFPYSLFLW